MGDASDVIDVKVASGWAGVCLQGPRRREEPSGQWGDCGAGEFG